MFLLNCVCVCVRARACVCVCGAVECNFCMPIRVNVRVNVSHRFLYCNVGGRVYLTMLIIYAVFKDEKCNYCIV